MPELGEKVICAETKKEFVIAKDSEMTFNYALDGTTGEILSDDGVVIRTKRELEKHSDTITLYVSSDGRYVATWKNHKLGDIISSSKVRLSRWSHVHGREIHAYTVRDCFGRLWYGRGSPSIAINLKPKKSK